VATKTDPDQGRTLTGSKHRTKRGQQRQSVSKRAPVVARLRAFGWTHKRIAEHLGISERSVYETVRYIKAGQAPNVSLDPDPKSLDELEPEIRRLVQDLTADAFKEFYERYSGYPLADVHLDWVRRALLSKRVLINCPPRHNKSTIFSVWFPVWLICRNRNIQILVISQTDDFAKKFLRHVGAILTENAVLKNDFGRFRSDLADIPWMPLSGKLTVDGRDRQATGDFTIESRGVLSQIMGKETHWLIVDDPCSIKNSTTPGDRDKVSEWFHSEALSRLEPDAHATVIGQRIKRWDLYGELISEEIDGVPRWEHINYPAVLDWDKHTVLWEDKWGWEDLMERRIDLGKDRFEAMYQQNPMGDTQRLARTEWIYGDNPGCLDHDRDAYAAPDLKHKVRVVSLDPSPTKFWALLVADVEPASGVIHVLEIVHDKLQVRDAVRQLHRMRSQYEFDSLIIEKNAAHHFLQNPQIEDLRRQVAFLVHRTGINKWDQGLGIESLAVDFEYGRVRLPYGDPEGVQMTNRLVTEAQEWPQGRTDDIMMALWFIKANMGSLVARSQLYSQTKASFGWAPLPPRLLSGWS
jgi:hypothetical protein